MSSTVAIGLAILGFVIAILSPIFATVYISARAEKRHREDLKWQADREDLKEELRVKAAAEVSANAARVATDLAASQKKIADAAEAAKDQAAQAAQLLVANNELVARTSAGISGQLGVIHTLVNSNMTTEMVERRDAEIRSLALLQEVIDLKRTAGQEPSRETLATVTAVEDKIADLSAALEDRAKAQERANREVR